MLSPVIFFQLNILNGTAVDLLKLNSLRSTHATFSTPKRYKYPYPFSVRVFRRCCIFICDNKLCECYVLVGSSKNDICERIIRVPAVMRWTEELAKGQIIGTPVTVMDVMPTVLELLNHSAGALYSDGKSLLPVLFNLSQESQHKYIFHYIEVTKPAAVTSGPYKVVYTELKGKYQVYDLCYLGH